MIECLRQHLEQRCVQRGYTLEEVMPCVVSQDGNKWTVDADHQAYPREARLPDQTGPGAQLKTLLAKFGFSATSDCACNFRASEMDERGVEWCEANIDVIVGWLREEATKRGLPFVDAAGRWLVRRAIANARKAAG